MMQGEAGADDDDEGVPWAVVAQGGTTIFLFKGVGHFHPSSGVYDPISRSHQDYHLAL